MARTDEEKLVISIEARIADLEKNMARAAKTSERRFKEIRTSAKTNAAEFEAAFVGAASRATAALGKIGLGGLAAGGVAGLISGFRDIAKGVAEVGDQAKIAGVKVKAFTELKFVAEQNRIGVDALTDGLKELNIRASEFITTGGGSASEAFKRLGYGSDELSKKLQDPSALFTEIIGKLATLDKASGIRLSDEIFGGSGGQEFVKLIEQGEKGIRDTIRAANDLGIVMDEEMIAKAAEVDRLFNVISTTVGTSLKGAIVAAAGELSEFIDSFRDFQNQADRSLQTKQASLGMRRIDLETERSQIQNGDAGFFMNPNGPLGKGRIHEIELELARIAAEEAKIVNELNTRVKAVGKAAGDTSIVPFAQLPADDTNRRVQLAAARESIAKIESSGSGGYSAVGSVTASGDRAYGRYQVMGNNIADWSKEAIGTALTTDQFLNNPELQDKIFDHVFGGYVDRFGMEGASQAWFGGPGAVGKTGKKDMHGTTVGDYGKRFTDGIGTTGEAWSGLRAATSGTVSDTAKLTAEYESLGQVATSTLQGIASALSDGKLEGRELLSIMMDLAQSLLTMPSKGGGTVISNLLAGVGGGGGFKANTTLGGFLGLAGGGRVAGPGTSTSDSIPAMLSDGEHVTRAAMVKKYGPLLDAINSDRVPHLSAGGTLRMGAPVAPRLASRSAAAASSNAPQPLVVNVNGASGDPHVRELVRQGIQQALADKSDADRRGGFGSMQQRFASQKG